LKIFYIIFISSSNGSNTNQKQQAAGRSAIVIQVSFKNESIRL